MGHCLLHRVALPAALGVRLEDECALGCQLGTALEFFHDLRIFCLTPANVIHLTEKKKIQHCLTFREERTFPARGAFGGRGRARGKGCRRVPEV